LLTQLLRKSHNLLFRSLFQQLFKLFIILLDILNLLFIFRGGFQFFNPRFNLFSPFNAAIVTAGLGGLGAAKEIAAQAQEASETADQLMGLLHNQNFLIMAAVIGLGAAIWYWRKKNMDRDGV
jgi:hypothetical protein